MNPDPLKDSLGEIAESVQNTDLYDRALRRSRRIGRNRAVAVGGAALAVLGLAGAGLLFRPVGADPSPVVAPPSRTAPSVAASTPSPGTAPSRPAPSSAVATADAPPVTPTTAVPRSRTLSDLPGRVFYRSGQDRVIRLSPDGAVRTVLETAYEAVSVSPGGDRVVYVADGALRLAGSDDPVLDATVDPQQLPAWSPDGTRLIVAAPEAAVLTVATGKLVKLPESLGGEHFRWSGDGRKLIYGTSTCRLKVAAADSRSGTTVPVIGDPENARNPDGSAACRPLSADRTGRRITAPLESPGGPSSGLLTADALVDTGTGDVLPLPVSGRVTGLLFGPDGNLLIRTSDGDRSTLSVLSPDGELLVRAPEPAGVGDAELLAYAR